MSLRLARSGAVALVSVAACSFAPSGEVAPDDDGGVDDGGNRVLVLRDDTAADFAIVGTLADALVIEPWGALAPAAYHVGGLLAFAANDERFGEPDEATWTSVTSGSPAGAGVWTRPLVGDPIGVGLDSGDSWTYWAEGEVWLDAGDTSFLVDADDAGFIEIAPPGGDYTRVVNARLGVGSGSFTAAAAGWFPIRLAAVEGVGGSRFDVQLFVNGSMTPEPLASPRLRARVDHMRGMMLAGWDNSLLQGRPEHTLSQDPLVDADFGAGTPVGVGIGSADFWSLRWAGQFYVTTPGTYRLDVEADDGHRLYVGSYLVSDLLVGSNASRMIDVDLGGGWNDVVLDLNENTGNARARLRVVSGPEPGLDRELPASRLRPLEPRGERLETGADATDRPAADNDPAGGAVSAVAVGGFVGATVTSVDVMVGVNHSRIGDLQIRLVHPGGNEVLLRNNSDAGGSGSRTLRFTTESFDGTPASGAWRLRVTDTVQGNAGTLTDYQLAVHMGGGPEQVARVASYTSLVRDLGADVTAIDALRFAARLPAGAGVAVRLRACDAPEQCATAPWSEPLTEGGGAAPGLPPSRYVQYRVELTSDGERDPELDWLELSYRIPAT